MKIHILHPDPKFQPAGSKLEGPPHNVGFTIEKDMLDYLYKRMDMLTPDPDAADWHYLPIFWTYWNLNHDYGRAGKDELQAEVDRIVLDSNKTFTVCQYDGGPGIPIGNTKVFLSAKTDDFGIPAPPIVKPHKLPEKIPPKKYLASFVGKFRTHPMRAKMYEALKERKNVFFEDRGKGEEYYVNKILESWFVLCPRGSAANSFRFFETMQLGSIPIYYGDIDARPFKKFIDWDEFSYFTNSVEGLVEIIDTLQERKFTSWRRMGGIAKKVWETRLWNQGWCNFVLKELELHDTTYRDICIDGSKDVRRGPHREVVCKLINDNDLKVGVELGVWYGNGARMILDMTKMKTLYGVDHYRHDSANRYEPSFPQSYLDKVLKFVKVNLEKYYKPGCDKCRFQLIRKHTDDAIGDVPDGVDFIFIDADHSYDRVKSDLENWYPKLREGGIMSGHDYAHKNFTGVKKAVDEFFKDKHKVYVEDHHVWWIRK